MSTGGTEGHVPGQGQAGHGTQGIKTHVEGDTKESETLFLRMEDLASTGQGQGHCLEGTADRDLEVNPGVNRRQVQEIRDPSLLHPGLGPADQAGPCQLVPKLLQ